MDSPGQSEYVIQRHTVDGGGHFDLMLRRGQVLWTWRLDRLPDPAGGVLTAVRIADHRLAYLSYEGPIHGGAKGACTIADRGRMRWIEVAAERIVVQLLDGAVAGVYELARDGSWADRWVMASRPEQAGR